jgi:hypothetical protein
MTIPVEAVKQWLEADPAWAGYGFQVFQGMWRDSTANANRRLCVLTAVPGRASTTQDVNYDSVRVILLSAQKGNADTNPLRSIVYGIRDRLKTDNRNCDVTLFRMQGGPVGPGYTLEERVWYEFNITTISG